MKKVIAIIGSLLVSVALAEQTPENLKGFKSVCINGSFKEKANKNEAILDKLIQRMYDTLDKAKIAIADSPCQSKGLSANKQLNLYFDFFTTTSGKVYQVSLEGWLDKEGPYKSVSLWTDSYIGGMEEGSGALEAADGLDELLGEFVADWKKSH